MILRIICRDNDTENYMQRDNDTKNYMQRDNDTENYMQRDNAYTYVCTGCRTTHESGDILLGLLTMKTIYGQTHALKLGGIQ